MRELKRVLRLCHDKDIRDHQDNIRSERGRSRLGQGMHKARDFGSWEDGEGEGGQDQDCRDRVSDTRGRHVAASQPPAKVPYW